MKTWNRGTKGLPGQAGFGGREEGACGLHHLCPPPLSAYPGHIRASQPQSMEVCYLEFCGSPCMKSNRNRGIGLCVLF